MPAAQASFRRCLRKPLENLTAISGEMPLPISLALDLVRDLRQLATDNASQCIIASPAFTAFGLRSKNNNGINATKMNPKNKNVSL